MDLSRKDRFIEACFSGLIASSGFGFLVTLVEGLPLQSDVPAMVAVLSIWFGIVFAAIYFAGPRGLIGLWIVGLLWELLLVWQAYPIDAFISVSDHPVLTRGLGMSPTFWRWSVIALPVFVVTVIILQRRLPLPSRNVAAISIGWLLLLLIARAFARVAWDVFPPLYPMPLVSSFGWLVLAPAMWMLSLYVLAKLWRASTTAEYSAP